jgi:hypothetical protein
MELSMSRLSTSLTLIGVLALAPLVGAQTPNAGAPAPRRPAGPQRCGPPAGMPMGMPMGAPMGGRDISAMLLAHTGDLKLSDQQVTRLAAIARRSAERRDAMRRSMDSLMTARRDQAPDSARSRMGPPPALQAGMERMREQAHADLRDALGVLTPDQQATAWEIVAMRGGGGGPAGPMAGARMRGGPGARGRPGAFGPGTRRVPPGGPDGAAPRPQG